MTTIRKSLSSLARFSRPLSVALAAVTLIFGLTQAHAMMGLHAGAAGKSSNVSQSAIFYPADGISGDGRPNEDVGFAVALSGNTMVAGAPGHAVGTNSDQGAAYIYAWNGTSWAQQAELVAADGQATDEFGIAVGVSGTTLVVGATYHAVGGVRQGAAYVYTWNGAAWVLQAELTASDGQAGDNFGASVAISGTTIVIGAGGHQVGTNAYQGAAYVFSWNGTSWVPQAELTSLDGQANDSFGGAVAVSGSSIVVGARIHATGGNPQQGAAYVFSWNGSAWVQQAELTASDGGQYEVFGSSVAISGTTIAVGAPDHGGHGAVYVYSWDGSNWNQQGELTPSDGGSSDSFGSSVAVSGSLVAVGAPYHNVSFSMFEGAAYVYSWNGTSWSQQAEFNPPDAFTSFRVGTSVAISGSSVAVGAPGGYYGGSNQQGVAYVYFTSGSSWSQQGELSSTTGEPDNFGTSVAISGNTMVVGADYHAVSGTTDQGACYVYGWSGTSWNLQVELTASDGGPFDYFGNSVAISGTTIVVGAYGHAVGGVSQQGAAYVYSWNGTSWIQQAELTAADGLAFDNFGSAVAISGSTIAVGATGHQVGGNSSQGAIYVYSWNGTSWIPQGELTSTDGQSYDELGRAISIFGSTIVAGSAAHKVGSNGYQGAVYVYSWNGTSWTQQAELTAADGLPSDNFGESVSISGATLVVGAPDHAVGGNNYQGSAYVYSWNGTSWVPQAELKALVGHAFDAFGISVAVSGSTIVVGANNAGAAYVFSWNGSAGSQQAVLTPSPAQPSSAFGESVAVSGGMTLVGAPFAYPPGVETGGAYLYLSGSR